MTKYSILPLLAALAACSAAPAVSVHDGWARETGNADNAAAYLTLRNSGGPDRLIGVSSAIGGATLHETSMDGGIMRMRPIDSGDGLPVPAKGELVLKPGGAHVMIMGIKRPLRAGERFDLTLTFAKSGSERAVITVKPAAEFADAQR